MLTHKALPASIHAAQDTQHDNANFRQYERFPTHVELGRYEASLVPPKESVLSILSRFSCVTHNMTWSNAYFYLQQQRVLLLSPSLALSPSALPQPYRVLDLQQDLSSVRRLGVPCKFLQMLHNICMRLCSCSKSC